MATWPEISNVKKENRYELILSGDSVSNRLEKHGLSDELFSCSGLNFLQISETCLQKVPSKIKNLHNLTSLILHSNKLTEFCPEIGELTKLKILNVSNNQIKEIPDVICRLEALTSFNVRSNMIEKIPNLSNNAWLNTVDFSHNSLTDITDLCNNTLIRLAEVHLKGNKIKNIPSEIKELSALKMIDLSNNEISQVIQELGDISKLKDVNLQDNPLADKRLAKLVLQGKSKSILDYIKEHCPRGNSESAPSKGKKGKTKGKAKHDSGEGENLESTISCKFKIVVTRTENICTIKRTKFVQDIRQHILACVVKNVTMDSDTVRKFIQLQQKMHNGICDKRNFATIATHDLSLCKGKNFIYTALSPEGLKIIPLSRNKEFTGKELFVQLQQEAEALRKEKKRNTYSGIHKFLRLLEGKALYPCLLNSENVVISFPPLTNSDVTKISTETREIFIEVTSAGAQGHCKKVLDLLLKEMLQNGIGTSEENESSVITVEQVRIEEPEGSLIAVYPSRADLDYGDDTIQVIRH